MSSRIENSCLHPTINSSCNVFAGAFPQLAQRCPVPCFLETRQCPPLALHTIPDGTVAENSDLSYHDLSYHNHVGTPILVLPHCLWSPQAMQVGARGKWGQRGRRVPAGAMGTPDGFLAGFEGLTAGFFGGRAWSRDLSSSCSSCFAACKPLLETRECKQRSPTTTFSGW